MNQGVTNRAVIGLFYGSSTCYTEIIAEKIVAQLNLNQSIPRVDLHNIVSEPIATMNEYDFLILGIPTWDYGELQEDWENHWDALDDIDFTGKQTALFGIGDQVGYPEWFLDALGYLWAQVTALGARAVGYTSTEGFEFAASKALTSNNTQFVGLAIDDENQPDLTDKRVEEWCQQILNEFGLT